MKSITKNAMKAAALIALTFSAVSVSAKNEPVPADEIATLRMHPIDIEPTPPALKNEVDHEGTYGRAYPTQAPMIPHKANKYQIDKKVNQCLSCHDRSRIKESGAPMVSVTHYMNRDNHVLAQVSPRRYFCTQCHVPQDNAEPLVDNVFIDVDKLLDADAAKKAAKH